MLNTAKQLGLTEKEYSLIVERLKREPNLTETGLFSAMWSEHCSYKHSKKTLKQLPVTGEKILVGPGENAGAVDIGSDFACVFKIESHNHPSAIQPYQGAATGVGGILRDIFTMGARPIALMDPLRFGELDNPDTKRLLEGVVKGIGDYGNCVGIPTVGGETFFSPVYEDNPLVNVMCIGITSHDSIIGSTAKGIKNPVLYFGNKTGRDGIHGASFASAALETEDDRRSAVQVGDPFMEKIVMEATLELIESGVLVAIQDMGAAGLICSSSELAAKGKCGIRLNLDAVPVRANDMNAFEIMLSESQERMLAVLDRNNVDRAFDILKKWDIPFAIIGELTADNDLTVYQHGDLEAKVPVASLVDDVPDMDRKISVETYSPHPSRRKKIKHTTNYLSILKTFLSSPQLSGKKWITEQYDTQVGLRTLPPAGEGCALLRIFENGKILAVTTDGNGRWVEVEPYTGTQMIVAEAARNILVTGAKPLAVTNCLNFGNPGKDRVFYQFKESVRGMSAACRSFNTPVTGGNVSFYNETRDGEIYPTPVIGMIGIMDDISHRITPGWKDEGDVVILLGPIVQGLGGGEYESLFREKEADKLPDFDISNELILHKTFRKLHDNGLIKSAQDVSLGGLLITLAEKSIFSASSIGFRFTLPRYPVPIEDFLFSEAGSRIVISASPENIEVITEICSRENLGCTEIGRTEEELFTISEELFTTVTELKSVYEKSLENFF